jgi:superoxide oxidase
MRDTGHRFNPLTLSIHWLTLGLMVAVYALIELRGYFPKGSDPREAMKAWHFMLGLTVFGLLFARLPLRLAFRTPAIEPAPPGWQQSLALLVHVALYAFLVAMPLLGWLELSLKDKPIPFFGLALPPLAAPDKALADTVGEIHETLGTAGYYLIGLHSLAALYHHYIVHDDTLLRMLPWRARKAA